MRVPLPGAVSMGLWRNANGIVGAQVSFKGTDGLFEYQAMFDDRETIDAEFAAAGIAPPEWLSEPDGSSIRLTDASPTPWGTEQIDAQVEWFLAVANRLVNSLPPRLLRLAESS